MTATNMNGVKIVRVGALWHAKLGGVSLYKSTSKRFVNDWVAHSWAGYPDPTVCVYTTSGETLHNNATPH